MYMRFTTEDSIRIVDEDLVKKGKTAKPVR